ncbi:hypothetical protein SeMB42_g04730 [Synchytrium endobioticum]|uniref:Uncharacterized protein n=1 Tax=Synchytrium endobioticum TaxID=286115 RepID=A0A507CZH7_9FUNG|nr:hypothetical protein SeMB42_g04730 [Synchytrium endobioticum]TPX44310.1 hypothetical protein SeLEV6574_g04578 [Synchytrium endobioticum]
MPSKARAVSVGTSKKSSKVLKKLVTTKSIKSIPREDIAALDSELLSAIRSAKEKIPTDTRVMQLESVERHRALVMKKQERVEKTQSQLEDSLRMLEELGYK